MFHTLLLPKNNFTYHFIFKFILYLYLNIFYNLLIITIMKKKIYSAFLVVSIGLMVSSGYGCKGNGGGSSADSAKKDSAKKDSATKDSAAKAAAAKDSTVKARSLQKTPTSQDSTHPRPIKTVVPKPKS
jgi:hypothetical protein